MNRHIFDKNIQALQKKQPALAERLLGLQVPKDYTVVYSKSGHPVLKSRNITFHSLYDPVTEGRKFVESHLDKKALRPGDKVVVFGLGFAYHILEMLNKNINALIIEPRIEIIRLAMEHVDLSDVISKMNIQTQIEQADFSVAGDMLWGHQPSVKYNKAVFDRLKHTDCAIAPISNSKPPIAKKNRLKIVVMTPIYGGSFPIAAYSFRALKNLGHEVELWDSSIFEKAFKMALELNIDDGNKKVLSDLFLHLISEMFVASCSSICPDLVIALAQAPVSIKALERFRNNQITTAFWFVEDYQLMPYWKRYAPYYDFFFTIQKDGFMDELKKHGVHYSHYLPLAADPEIHRPLKLAKHEIDEYGSEISFMGAGYYNRQKLFMGLLDLNFKIWGTGWDSNSIFAENLQRNGMRLSNDDIVKVFNATTINLNLHSSVCHEGVNPFGDFVNPRTFETASCRGFQLVDHRSLLADHFSLGDEIISYSCPEELRGLIEYYLQHSEERNRIAAKSRERILKEHTYEHRMQELLSFVAAKKPECFYYKNNNIPLVRDTHAFCMEHPELKSIIESAGNGMQVNLDQIVSMIGSQSSTLQYHEAIFLLIKDFQQLFQEKTV